MKKEHVIKVVSIILAAILFLPLLSSKVSAQWKACYEYSTYVSAYYGSSWTNYKYYDSCPTYDYYCSGNTPYYWACAPTCTPVNGDWSGWGACSVTCGGGYQYRSCNNPTPSCGGAYCSGSSWQTCNTQACCTPPACGSGLTCYGSACGSSCSSGYTQCLSGSQVVCCMPPCTPNCAGKSCGDNGCGGSCGTCPNAGISCRYSSTCDAWNYRNTCSSGSCTGATEWTADSSDNSACNGYTCASGKICSSGSCIISCSGCLISGTCYSTGAANPSNGCQKCDTATSTSSWTNLINGVSCTTSTGASGTCQSGVCTIVDQKPTITSFTISPSSPKTGEVITISASGSDDKKVNWLYLTGTGIINNWHQCSGTACSNSWTVTHNTAGTYTYTLTVYDSNSQTASQAKDVIVSNPPPAAPSSPSPANGAIGVSTTPTLDWSDVISSNGWYYVYYKKSTDAAYTSSPQWTSSQFTIGTGLSPNTVYNWNVRACNPGPVCTDSSTWSFTTTAPACSAPTGLGCSEADQTQTKLSWNAVTGATNYKAEWCKNTEAFGSANCGYTTTSNAYATITGLSAGTTYNFRVRVESATGCNVPGSWSSTKPCSTTTNAQCWDSCIGKGYARGECTNWQSSYGCSGSGSNFCYFGRIDNGDQNCGWFTNCWCSNVQNCDSCSSVSGACTSSGCAPQKVSTASCTSGNCNGPHVECAYLKKTSGGSGQGSCVVGEVSSWQEGGWEGKTCSSWTAKSPCGCSSTCSNTYCDLSCTYKTASKTDACPDVNLYNPSAACHVRLPCAGGTAAITAQSGTTGGPCWNTASMYDGVWSTSNKECVQCSGTKKIKLLADTASIKVDCQGNAPSSSLCESACGSDALCDEKNSGDCTSSTSLQKCSSSCSPISSCGDGTVNCGEECEPKGTATCDNSCKKISTCKDCANANSMDKSSISFGETATGTLCSISSTNANDWFKVTANNNGKLIVEMTPSAADLDLEVDKEIFVGGGCNNLVNLGTSKNGGSTKETVIVDATASYTYWIKTYYYSGSGATGTITAKLVECTANNALDTACPSAKPYCNNNVCVECLSDTNCATNPNGKYCDTANNKCVECLIDSNCESYTPPKTCGPPLSTYPNRIARCGVTSKTCDVCGQCFSNSDCINNFCCDADTALPTSDRGNGQCATNVYKQKYLCA